MSDVSKGAREEIRVPGRAEPLGRFYTDAVRAGDFVFISGQAGVDENRKIVARNDAGAQCRQTLENMGAVLAAAGGGFKDVVMVTVYLEEHGRPQQHRPRPGGVLRGRQAGQHLD